MKYLALAFAVAVGACDRTPEPAVTTDTTQSTAVTVAPPVPPSTDTLHVERSRVFDFDEDGKPETLVMRANGEHWDSMTIVLTIESPEGRLLYADTLNTTGYLGLDPDPEMTQVQNDSIIQYQLDQFLADDAFMPTEGNFDDANIDLRNGLEMSDEEFARFEKEIMSRPMFRYYIGGESSTGITFSTILNRFVETFICC